MGALIIANKNQQHFCVDFLANKCGYFLPILNFEYFIAVYRTLQKV